MSRNIKDIAFYQKKICKLRVDRANGLAPHKPILLLSVFELIKRGIITSNQIYLDAELIATFLKYWRYFGSEQHNAALYLPFYHLKSDRFWHLKTRNGLDKYINSLRPRGLRPLQEIVSHAELDAELYELLRDESNVHLLIYTLIDHWFNNKDSVPVEHLLGKDALLMAQEELKESGGLIYSEYNIEDEERTIVRSSAFRRTILGLYERRCACCNLQIISNDGSNIVDGAHIRPFSKFFDDRIVNGIALCKNHHWAFDRGWFGIDNDYKIRVSKNLSEGIDSPPFLSELNGTKITLPSSSSYYPDQESLSWHYINCFQD